MTGWSRDYPRDLIGYGRRPPLAAWPLGWYSGRDSPKTRRQVVEHGGYEYDSDYCGDELPLYLPVERTDGKLPDLAKSRSKVPGKVVLKLDRCLIP